jgi:hypothetical protein
LSWDRCKVRMVAESARDNATRFDIEPSKNR